MDKLTKIDNGNTDCWCAVCDGCACAYVVNPSPKKHFRRPALLCMARARTWPLETAPAPLPEIDVYFVCVFWYVCGLVSHCCPHTAHRNACDLRTLYRISATKLLPLLSGYLRLRPISRRPFMCRRRPPGKAKIFYTRIYLQQLATSWPLGSVIFCSAFIPLPFISLHSKFQSFRFCSRS